MRRFAEIDPITGAVRCVFDWPDEIEGDPVYQPGVAAAVEVTGMDPEPANGWVYLGGEWIPAPAPEQPAEPTP